MRVGLVLGAGGYAGHAFHAGVLSALEAHTGWDPREAAAVVGTSAGSIVGAMLRAGKDLPAIARGIPSEENSERPHTQPRPGLRPMAPGLIGKALKPPFRVRPTVAGAGLLPAGRVPLQSLRIGVDRLHDGWPEQTLWIVAVDMETGRRTVFGRDGEADATVGEAVAASCAIPGWFAPPVISGHRYVDGGVHSPTNADLLAKRTFALDLDLLVVSSPMSVAGGHYTAKAALNMRGTLRRLLRREIRTAWRAKVPVLTFQPTGRVLAAMGLNGMNPMGFDDVFEVTQQAAADRLARRRVHDLVGQALDELSTPTSPRHLRTVG